MDLPERPETTQDQSDNRPSTNTQSKKPRPVISCLECRRKKLKCDRTHPCQQCVKIGRPSRCEYQAGQEPEELPATSLIEPFKRRRVETPETNGPTGGIAAVPQGTTRPENVVPRSGVIEDLQQRVARLEQALQLPANPEDPSISAYHTPPDLHRTSVVAAEQISSRPQRPGNFGDACNFLRRIRDNGDNEEVARLRNNLSNVHNAIKKHDRDRLLQQGPPPTPSFRHLNLPPQNICEQLAVLYFDNLEHCFRILHWPDFRIQLQRLFTPGMGETACHYAFLPQLVGVLAMAARLGTHQECEIALSYPIIQHKLAIEYISTFLHNLTGRQKYQLPALQLKLLYMIALWVSLERLEDIFRLSGEILRDALVMKLDQDPSTLPNISVYEGELRRKNWMTIVESDLMLSILCKMPCMVPCYTTKSPQNVNDAEIHEDLQQLPESHPTEEWTDGLCQYVLSQSFPRRLAACQKVQTPHSVNPADILASTRYFEKVLSELPPPLRFTYLGDAASKTPPRLMARMEFDITIRRPLMHVYSCLAWLPNASDVQCEARSGYLQSCLMITTYQDLFDPRFSEINVPKPQGYWDLFYNLYRHEVNDALRGLCLEVQRLNPSRPQEPLPVNVSSLKSGNGLRSQPAFTRTSIIHSVKDILEPMKRRLSHRGARFKDIVYFTVIFTSVVSTTASQSDAKIMQAMHELIQECRSQLEHDGIRVDDAEVNTHEERKQQQQQQNEDWPAIGWKSDPSWADFPDLEMLDSWED